MMALSSSARNPIESTRRIPSPTRRSSGTIFLSRASTLALHPEQAGDREAPDVGVEDPDGQAPPGQGHGQVDGDRGLAHPALARGDGQHPGGGGDVGGRRRSSRALQRARAMSALRWSASISPGGDRHDPHAGEAPTRVSTSVRIWVRSGQPATVRATSTSTVPPGDADGRVTMPRSTMLSPSSGSTHRRSAARTASSVRRSSVRWRRSSDGGASDRTCRTWSPGESYRPVPRSRPDRGVPPTGGPAGTHVSADSRTGYDCRATGRRSGRSPA